MTDSPVCVCVCEKGDNKKINKGPFGITAGQGVGGGVSVG
jgi:hypothetical protein